MSENGGVCVGDLEAMCAGFCIPLVRMDSRAATACNCASFSIIASIAELCCCRAKGRVLDPMPSAFLDSDSLVEGTEALYRVGEGDRIGERLLVP